MKARYFAYVAIAASLLLSSGSFAQEKPAVKPAPKKVAAVKDTTAKKAKHVKKAAKKSAEKKAEEVKK